MNFTPQEAQALWQAHAEQHATNGAHLPDVRSYLPEAWKRDYRLAMDAQPGLTTDPNSALPAMLTTMIDPQVFKVLFAPTKAAVIIDEQQKGTWLDETAMFPVVEHTGEVSSYGDNNNNGSTGVNMNWPQRQSYLFQIIKQYGERELERAGLGRINFVSELDVSAATILNRFSNLTYFFGVNGLQNYGLLNDPNLSASLAPGTKVGGSGNKWITSGAITATPNEIYADFEALFLQLVNQTGGLVDQETKICVAMSPGSAVAITAANSFGVNVRKLLKENFPNIRIETAVQYGAVSAANPQGIAAGNLVQMIAEEIEGQKVAYCAFNSKMRAHNLVRDLSSFKQKVSAGTWGSIIRMPIGISSMVGV